MCQLHSRGFVVWLCLISLPYSLAAQAEKPSDTGKALAVLKRSKDKEELASTARSLIRGQDPKAIDQLLLLLADPDFLGRLDSEEDYKFASSKLRVRDLLECLAKLPSPRGEEAILKLATNPIFAKSPDHVDGLILASRHVEKASGKLIDYLLAEANNPFSSVHSVFFALTAIGSAEACKAMEKVLLSNEHKLSRRQGLVLQHLVHVRYQPNIVGLYERLLAAGLKDKELLDLIVASMFEYRADEWFGAEASQFPPPSKLKNASTEVLQELAKLADQSVKLDITEKTKEGIRKGQKEIQEVLASRVKKKTP
ncbi:MAG: hypothetical protein JNM56_35995 [Planctomycetia bacterium]|nr:hypothetical protein [Planctomycetia bacterium]